MSDAGRIVKEIVAIPQQGEQWVEYVKALANLCRIPSELLLSPKVGTKWSVNEQGRWTRKKAGDE